MTPLIASILLHFASAALPPGEAADLVMIDGLGPTSLIGFECVAIARSAVVSSVCHDARRQVAVAVVGGRARAYCGVSRPLVDAWLAAPSMGRFHAERIETPHRCERAPLTGA